MANWYGTARSNYVKVKDVEAAIRDLAGCDIEIYTHPTETGYIMLAGCEDDGGFRFERYNENDEFEEELDLKEWATKHLCEGQVLILVEVGAEKLRYVTGWSTAYSWDGRILTVNISSTLATLIKTHWGIDPERRDAKEKPDHTRHAVGL